MNFHPKKWLILIFNKANVIPTSSLNGTSRNNYNYHLLSRSGVNVMNGQRYRPYQLRSMFARVYTYIYRAFYFTSRLWIFYLSHKYLWLCRHKVVRRKVVDIFMVVCLNFHERLEGIVYRYICTHMWFLMKNTNCTIPEFVDFGYGL